MRWNSVWRETVASRMCNRTDPSVFYDTRCSPWEPPCFTLNVVSSHLLSFRSRKGGEMKQRLAWNSGEPCVQSYRPLSILWHTLLAMGTPLFHAKRRFISPPFLSAAFSYQPCVPIEMYGAFHGSVKVKVNSSKGKVIHWMINWGGGEGLFLSRNIMCRSNASAPTYKHQMLIRIFHQRKSTQDLYYCTVVTTRDAF